MTVNSCLDMATLSIGAYLWLTLSQAASSPPPPRPAPLRLIEPCKTDNIGRAKTILMTSPGSDWLDPGGPPVESHCCSIPMIMSYCTLQAKIKYIKNDAIPFFINDFNKSHMFLMRIVSWFRMFLQNWNPTTAAWTRRFQSIATKLAPVHSIFVGFLWFHTI